MKPILGTGLSGMVGNIVVDTLSNDYTFENLSLEVGVDITKPETVHSYVSKSEAEWILHFAAKTQVDEAETERAEGENSSTWKVNVGATKILVDACKTYHKKLLYISTDFVFPGGEHIFTEDDTPSPIGWYAITKYEGEKCVQSLQDRGVIVRLSFPYGHTTGAKKDFVGKLRERFEANQPISAPVDQVFTPTYIPDIAMGIKNIIEKNASGIYHLVGSQHLTSYEASLLIAQTFGYNASLVQSTTASEYYKDKAPRALKLRISNSKIQELGIIPRSFSEGLSLLKANEN